MKNLIYLFILLSGSSVLIQCGFDGGEPAIDVEFIYKNDTEAEISCSCFLGGLFVPPNQQQEIILEGVPLSDWRNSLNYSPRIISGIIYYNEIYCDSLRRPDASVKEGPTDIVNYEFEILRDREVRFTYTFTEENFSKAVLCE